MFLLNGSVFSFAETGAVKLKLVDMNYESRVVFSGVSVSSMYPCFLCVDFHFIFSSLIFQQNLKHK